MINHTTKVTNYVYYGDLEKLIEDTYGFDEFNIACNEECSNGTTITGRADPNDLSDFDKADIANKKYMYVTSTYINDLAAKGLFPLGNYAIDVSW